MSFVTFPIVIVNKKFSWITVSIIHSWLKWCSFIQPCFSCSNENLGNEQKKSFCSASLSPFIMITFITTTIIITTLELLSVIIIFIKWEGHQQGKPDDSEFYKVHIATPMMIFVHSKNLSYYNEGFVSLHWEEKRNEKEQQKKTYFHQINLLLFHFNEFWNFFFNSKTFTQHFLIANFYIDYMIFFIQSWTL